MKNYVTAGVGDKVISEYKNSNGEIIRHNGVVIRIVRPFMYCMIEVNNGTLMRFNLFTGMHEYASEYGWLI